MFTESVLLLIGAAIVVAAGLPIVERLVEPSRWGPRYPVPDRLRQAARPVEVKRSFQPMDLGPDPARWPSEVERPYEGRPLPDWPSRSWDDPFFGAKARESARSPVAAPQRPDAARQPQGRPERRVDARETALPHEQRVVFEGVEATLPGLDDVERLMAQHGLAGTVQILMERTGWDFREAARYLARIRKQARH